MTRETVHAAQQGWVGFDTDTTLTASAAAAFAAAGFSFVVRYLSLGAAESAGDLTSSEVQTILSAGLALSAIQHAPKSGWQPTQQSGAQYGRNAAGNASAVGLPPGTLLWLDLEGADTNSSAVNVSSYCNAWFAAVATASYVPGLYVGYNSILDSSQLDALDVEYFWMSGSQVPYPAMGYCMVQSINSSYVMDGISYDRDAIQNDNLGKTPLLVWETKAPVLPALESRVPAFTGPSVSAPVLQRFRWAAPVLAGVLAYAAGVYTGPMILPGFGRAASTQEASPASTPVPAGKPAAPSSAVTVPPATEARSTEGEKPASEPQGTSAPVNSTAPGQLRVSPQVLPQAQPVPQEAPAPAVAPDSRAESPAGAKNAKPGSGQSLLVGSFREGDNADHLAHVLERAGYGQPRITRAVAQGFVWHVVRLGPYPSRAGAAEIAGQLKKRYAILALVRPGAGE